MFETYFLLFVGIFFFLIGVFGLFKEKLTINNAPILIFLFAGAGITFFTIMYNFKVPHF